MKLSHLIIPLLGAAALMPGLGHKHPGGPAPSAREHEAAMPVFVTPRTNTGAHIRSSAVPRRALCHVTGPGIDLLVRAPGLLWLPKPQSPDDRISTSCITTAVANNMHLSGASTLQPINLSLRRRARNVPFLSSFSGVLAYVAQVQALRDDPARDVFAYPQVLPVVLNEDHERTPL